MEPHDELEYLDKILLYLRDHAFNSEATIDKIYESVTGKQYHNNIEENQTDAEMVEEPGKIATINIYGTFYEQQRKLHNALKYLIDSDYIQLIKGGLVYAPTYAGLVKCSFGFVYEYRKWNKIDKLHMRIRKPLRCFQRSKRRGSDGQSVSQL